MNGKYDLLEPMKLVIKEENNKDKVYFKKTKWGGNVERVMLTDNKVIDQIKETVLKCLNIFDICGNCDIEFKYFENELYIFDVNAGPAYDDGSYTYYFFESTKNLEGYKNYIKRLIDIAYERAK